MMREQDFQNLLRVAESDLPRPPLDAARLARRVLDKHRSAARRRRALAVVVPVALLAVAWSLWSASRREGVEPVAAVSVPFKVAGADDLREMVAQADFGWLVARRINELTKRERTMDASAPLSASIPEIREQLEVVAYRMILRADALRAEMRPADEAIAICRDVVRLFPETYSAELARKRLADLGVSGGSM